jgi:hypothetical protein
MTRLSTGRCRICLRAMTCRARCWIARPGNALAEVLQKMELAAGTHLGHMACACGFRSLNTLQCQQGTAPRLGRLVCRFRCRAGSIACRFRISTAAPGDSGNRDWRARRVCADSPSPDSLLPIEPTKPDLSRGARPPRPAPSSLLRCLIYPA